MDYASLSTPALLLAVLVDLFLCFILFYDLYCFFRLLLFFFRKAGHKGYQFLSSLISDHKQ